MSDEVEELAGPIRSFLDAYIPAINRKNAREELLSIAEIAGRQGMEIQRAAYRQVLSELPPAIASMMPPVNTTGGDSVSG